MLTSTYLKTRDEFSSKNETFSRDNLTFLRYLLSLYGLYFSFFKFFFHDVVRRWCIPCVRPGRRLRGDCCGGLALRSAPPPASLQRAQCACALRLLPPKLLYRPFGSFENSRAEWAKLLLVETWMAAK